mgnify:FL=1|tara:strand:- start:129 stop:416 length:288 start_codon:yes stop_codon:yes gene_type:complete
MLKRIIMIGVLLTLTQGCSKYTPIVDSVGVSKFEKSNAQNIDYDLHNCEWKAADSKKKVKLFRRINFWITNPKAETIYTHMYRECMKGRNHNVLN